MGLCSLVTSKPALTVSGRRTTSRTQLQPSASRYCTLLQLSLC